MKTFASAPLALSAALVLGAPVWTPAWALDLLQAYQAATAWDANLRAARAGADAGKARVEMAQAQRRPTLTLGATANATDTSSLGSYSSYSAALRARYPVYRRALSLGVNQAEQVREETQSQLEQESRNLAVRVAAAYFEVLQAMDQQRLNESQRAFVATQLEAAQKALASGTGTRPDVDEAQARLDQVGVEALQIRQSLELARRSLQALMNQPPEGLATVDATRLPSQAPAAAELQRWLGLAEQHNAEIRTARARLAGARVGGAIAAAGSSPTLDAVAQVSRSGSESVSTVNQAFTSGAVGVELNIPLYTGGYVSAAVSQASAVSAQAEASLEATRRDVGLRTQREFQTVVESLARLQALEQARQSAERLVASTRRAVDAGVRTRLDVLNADDKLQTLQRDLSAARYQYLNASLRLQALATPDMDTALRAINGALAR